MLSVPLPSVGVRVPQSEPYLAGMFAELRCTIILDNSIDTQVDVAVEWQKNGRELTETDRIRVLSPAVEGGSRYDALIQFSILSRSADSGNYMCISTVFPTDNTSYITNSTKATSISFIITGIIILDNNLYSYIHINITFTTDPILTATVTPTVYSGKDIYPFNMFSLSCTATKPSNVILPIQLSWYRNGIQLDGSVPGITIQEEEVNDGMEKFSSLNVTSALTSNSGLYTCNAAVSIPESDTVTTNQTATVTIAGKET